MKVKSSISILIVSALLSATHARNNSNISDPEANITTPVFETSTFLPGSSVAPINHTANNGTNHTQQTELKRAGRFKALSIRIGDFFKSWRKPAVGKGVDDKPSPAFVRRR